MTEFEEIFEIVQYLNDQSKFIFDKLVTWFIFYLSLSLTGLVSGYLTILNSQKIKKKKITELQNQLLYWGSLVFYISTYISVIGCTTVIFFFRSQKTEIDRLIEFSNSKLLTTSSFNSQYITFTISTILFIFILLSFSLLWKRIRAKNKFENIFNVIFRKKPIKKNTKTKKSKNSN